MTIQRWATVLLLGAWAAAGCTASSGGSQAQGRDASLRDLVLAGDAATTLLPYFQSDVHTYDVPLSAGLTAASVTATPSDPAVRSVTLAQLGQTTATVAAGAAGSIALPAPGGTSTVRVLVTATDGKTTSGYTLRLARRAALGTEGALASLTDSLGYLHYQSGTTEYGFDVLQKELEAGYTITPTITDPLASLVVNGQPAQSGKPIALGLGVGENAISIAVISEDGTSQATTYTIHVNVLPTIHATGIALACPPAVGGGDVLAPAFTPANTTDKTVTWESSDPTIATVDDAGQVTVVKPTRQFDPPITLTATSNDGGFTASCNVHVLWFVDDFEDLPVGNLAAGGTAASIRKWSLFPAGTTGNGTLSIVSDGSNALQYTQGGFGGVLAVAQDAAWPAAIGGDYYVEARIKPLNNSTTSQKQLYLLGRYQGVTDWYGGGPNMQSTPRVEMNKMTTGGNGTNPYPAGSPSNWRWTRAVVPGQWYTVRFEMVGSNLTMYFDNELLGTVTDGTFTSGKIGLWTYQKNFEVDDVKVGDPADKPVLFGISPGASYAADVGDAPTVVTVTARKPNYGTASYEPDTFTAISSDPSVVQVAISGNQVSLTPVGAGSATITFASGSVPSISKAITATVTAFTMPTGTYGSLGAVTTPAALSTGVNADTPLRLTFDAGSTLTGFGGGSVRIYRMSDDVQVDAIKPTGEVDSLGYAGQAAVRTLNTTLLKADPATRAVTITPHHNKLAPNTEYYVVLPAGLVTGSSLVLNGTAYAGLGKAAGWSFTTGSALPAGRTTLTVNDDGTADFRTVQGALDYAMHEAVVNGATDTAVTVNVMNGTYDGPLFLQNKNNLTLHGESRDGVVIQYTNSEALNATSGDGQAPGTLPAAGGRSVFLVKGCDLLTLDTLTLKNNTRRTSQGGQAEVIYFNNDAGRLIAKHASFISEQDTLQLKGYDWFYDSLVAGNVDFIWGYSKAALFEESEIRSLGDTANPTSGGYLVQARATAAGDKGFVFLNSTLTHGPGPVTGDVPTGASAATYLARSGGDASRWDNVAYVKCKMDTHIKPVGWAYNTNPPNEPTPNPATATAASGWREYGTMDMSGTPVSLSARVGGYTLTLTEYNAGFSTRAQIFAAYNGGAGWNPAP